MVKNKIIIIILMILSSFSIIRGCNSECKPKILIAKKPVKVFRTYENDEQKVIYVLNPGEQCAVGRKKISKVYAYYEILSLAKGPGWVIAGDDFVIYEGERKK